MFQGGCVTVVGFVATEPKIRYTKDGRMVTSLRIGSTVRKIDRETGEWRDGETSFYSVSCWRSLASNAAGSLHKGQPVIVAGRLRTSNYEDRTGARRSDVEIDADTVGFDLSRGVAHFTRSQRASADAADLARGEAIRSGLAGDADLPAAADGKTAAGVPGGGAEMFDEQAMAELEHELDASAAEPAAG